MDPRAELADFLRNRRSRIQPDDVDIPTEGLRRRRAPGLRREEVARLAGMSVDYYTRLEQGRDVRPSLAVLTALGRALRLDDAEQRHLVTLASAGRGGGRVANTAPERVRPPLRRLLNSITGVPAFVLGRRMDVLAWNRMAAALITDFGALPVSQRNMMLLLFLDPAFRNLYLNWTEVAKESIAHLRGCTGRHPDDPRLAAIVGELSVKSAEFRQFWSGHDVKEKGFGRKEFNHPAVGRMSLDFETLALPDGPDRVLVTYTAEPGSPSQAALDLLAVIGTERFVEEPAETM